MQNTLIGLLEERAGAPGPTLLHTPADGRSVTLDDVLDKAQFLAGDFYDHGIRPGDVVGLVLQNGTGMLTALLGLMYAGAVPAPLALPVSLGGLDAYERHLRAVVADSGMRCVLFGPELRRMRARLDAALTGAPDTAPTGADTAAGTATTGTDPASGPGAPLLLDLDTLTADTFRLALPPAPEAPAFLQYTSGSTSAPKGVVLTHRNMTAGIAAIRTASAVTREDRLGLWLPLFHDMGLISLMVGLAHCSEVTLWQPGAFVRRPDRWLADFAARRCTLCSAPNFFYDLLSSTAESFAPGTLDLSAWRVAYNGAEPVQAATVERFAGLFAPHGFAATTMLPVYGMAEATLAVTFHTTGTEPRTVWADRDALADGRVARLLPGATGARALVALGRPVPGVRLRIDGDGAPDRVGEIQIAGEPVTSGYYRRPREPYFTDDGWLRTGDLGFLDDGELCVVGRIKDMIIVRGENLYPEDAEALVRDLPDVYHHRCVAVGGTDGDTETVVVVAETKLEDPDRRAALAEEIAAVLRAGIGLAAPVVHLVAPHSLPQTSSGKIQRNRVRAAFADRRPAPAAG